ncbi:MAG: hypothetical protein WBA88_17735 [Pseudaminobacter sp.]
MNLAMTMTLDGLIRALRWRAHELAEEIERGYREDTRSAIVGRAARAGMDGHTREQSDDRAGR